MFIIRRSEENPLISPEHKHPWEAVATFNWCPVKDGKKIHVVYRAMSERDPLEEPKINRSVIGRATSTDGVHFTDRAPFITPEFDFEKYGCEDPRVTKIDGMYYIFYTALGTYPFSADGIKVAVALSSDMKTVDAKHLVTPFNAKAMALFPTRVNGKYAALLTVNTDHPPARIAYAEFDRIEDLWSPEYWKKWYSNLDSHSFSLNRSGNDQVELGAPPLKTKAGWLVLYSHISGYGTSNTTFGIEALLLDKDNPRLIIGRTKGAFLVPEVYYEQTGVVPNIVFPSGALIRGEFLDIYYGASDTHCCTASVRLDDLLATLVPDAPALVKRFAGNPILSPRPGKAWEAHGVFNPAAIDAGGKIRILYRAMSDDDTSTVGYADSKDGFSIDERSDTPIYVPRADFETKHHPGNSGCEDPRIVFIDGTYYMTYTAYDGETPRVAITSISEKDFIAKRWNKWSLPAVITPPYIANKDACIIPAKTNSGYVFLHRVDGGICADILHSLDFTKEKVERCIEIMFPRRGMWDSERIGISAPPISTKEGWLLLYHGISKTDTYRVGAALLDKKDPTILLSRSATPLFEPVEDYELKGVVPKVVFPCGLVQRSNTLYIYYGGADQVVGVATAKLSEILKTLV